MRGIVLRYPYEVRSEAKYFGGIPELELPEDMLRLAEHIVDTKAARSIRPPSMTGNARH
jgi:DNA end-binding protein Ku